MRWRNGRAPHVMAYWFTSARMAATAASLISAGAAKSGKPWARLIAPCETARRVISRMTDSVNVAAFSVVVGMPEGYRHGAVARTLTPGRLRDDGAHRALPQGAQGAAARPPGWWPATVNRD